MATSVAILGTALPMNEPLRLIQLPGRVGFQALAIGLHWKTLTQMMAMTQLTAIPPRTMAAIRMFRIGKMRTYMSRMETLMMPTVVQ